MIYLIGGPPRCGKTTLAKLLSKSLGIPWVSTDTFESVTKEVLTSTGYFDGEFGLKRKNELFPKDVLRKVTCGSNDSIDLFQYPRFVKLLLFQRNR